MLKIKSIVLRRPVLKRIDIIGIPTEKDST